MDNLRCGQVYQGAARLVTLGQPGASGRAPLEHETRDDAALGVAAAQALGHSPPGRRRPALPVFSAPFRAFAHHELGLSLSAPEGSDLGVEGFFSFASGRNDFGLRVGALDAGDELGLRRWGAVSGAGSSRTPRTSRSTGPSPSASVPCSTTAIPSSGRPSGSASGGGSTAAAPA